KDKTRIVLTLQSAMAPVAIAEIAWAVEIGAIQIRRSIEPRAADVYPYAKRGIPIPVHRGIPIGRRHGWDDVGRLRILGLNRSIGRRLTIHLGFQLIDRVLLGLHFPLKRCDLFTLRFHE